MLAIKRPRPLFQICAIDVGTRNFAWCIVNDVHWQRPISWRHEAIVTCRGKVTRNEIVRCTRMWAESNRNLLESCDRIILENQMRIPFIVMNTVIQTMFFDRVVVVHPLTVGAYWKLPRRRELKKARGIEVVAEQGAMMPQSDKQDDLADAWLMAVYGLHKLSRD